MNKKFNRGVSPGLRRFMAVFISVCLIQASGILVVGAEDTSVLKSALSNLEISLDIVFLNESNEVELRIKNLTNKALILNELALKNPEILYHSKIGNRVKGGAWLIGLDRRKLVKEIDDLQKLKIGSVVNLKPGEVFLYKIDIRPFLDAILTKHFPEREHDFSIKLKFQFFGLLNTDSEVNLRNVSVILTPWLRISNLERTAK